MRNAVVTPSKPSRAKLLEESRASVQAQTTPAAMHAVMVDEKLEGPAIIRNRIVQNLPAEIDWLAPLDDDDLALPQHLELLVEQIENNDVIYSPPTGYGSGSIHEFSAKELPGRNHLGMTSLVRRSMFEKVGGFDPKAKFEDWDLWKRILKAGGRFCYVPTATWVYRQQEDSRNHDLCGPAFKRVHGRYAGDTLTQNWWDNHPRRKPDESRDNSRPVQVQRSVHPVLGNRQPNRTNY